MKDRYKELTAKYPHFVFKSYDHKYNKEGLEGRFVYELKNAHSETAFEFSTLWTIVGHGELTVAERDIDAMVLALGMVEAISYWKLTCAPRLTVQCGQLDDWQVDWWKKLFKKGLSEFFYLNGISDWDESLLHLTSNGQRWAPPTPCKYEPTRVMVPIGGGKDSITSVEVLKGAVSIVPVVMNPIQASKELIKYHGFTDTIQIARKLDPQIIELNSQGFLNGHIPFSAVLSIYTMIAGRIFGIADIALSNESSANEPTIIGTDINHQYSKSLEYEKDINQYADRYLDSNINYFSLLRPLNEYQITKIFAAADPVLHMIFRSCNKGSKQGLWCGKCPKCLFTYVMMHAHLPLSKMVEIYGTDMLNDSDMVGYFLSLTGQRTEKPFECVGTIAEVNTALARIKAKRHGNLPRLFGHWSEELTKVTEEELLSAYDEANLTAKFDALLRQKLSSVV